MWSIQGRVSRSYYLVLVNCMIFFLISGFLLGSLPNAFIFVAFGAPSIASFLSIFLNILFIPFGILYTIATIKRFHDRGKSGWWTLVLLVPVIGSIWTFVECGFLKGTDGPNKYGEDPLASQEKNNQVIIPVQPAV